MPCWVDGSPQSLHGLPPRIIFLYVITTILPDLCTTQGHRGPLVEFEFNCLDQNDLSKPQLA